MWLNLHIYLICLILVYVYSVQVGGTRGNLLYVNVLG